MLVLNHVPGPPLCGLIESMTLVVAPDYPFQREYLFPDGSVNLLINLGPDKHRAVLPGETNPRSYRRAWLSGEQRAPLLVERANHGYNLVVVRFHPGGASAFWGFALSEITDQVLELDDIWGRSATQEIVERVATRCSADEKFAEVEQILSARLTRPGPSALLVGALRLLEQSNLDIGVRTLASRLGTSHTWLIRTFERYVGLKPKLLQRILRFQRVIRLEDANPGLAWVAIAYRSGYSDQSHLIRDFRHFTGGLTPSAYRARRADYPNYVPLE